MSTVLLAVILTVGAGLLLCTLLVWGCERLADRRRLDGLAQRMQAEARIDNATRETFARMRAAARDQSEDWRRP